VKLNSSDQLEGLFSEDEALEVVAAMNGTSVDIIDISGGTYFPSAKSASDSAGRGPYFIGFAKRARLVTSKPLMLTGGFKTRAQEKEAVQSGAVDVVGLARALVLEPALPHLWMKNQTADPIFPRFSNAPEGGIKAWYTTRLTEIGADKKTDDVGDLEQTISAYETRNSIRTEIWLGHFGSSAV